MVHLAGSEDMWHEPCSFASRRAERCPLARANRKQPACGGMVALAPLGDCADPDEGARGAAGLLA